MNRIGFVVNPYAGMGGAVGLKGTDGCLGEARARGAVPKSPERAIRFLNALPGEEISILTASGSMGGDELAAAGWSSHQVVYTPTNQETTGEDTRQACRNMVAAGVDLIVFCGGDGTARDVYSVTGPEIPILGIPAGVKIYSAVFATSPERTAEILLRPDEAFLTDAEVMDVDEEEYRSGTLTTRIFGIAKVPYIPTLIQAGKEVFFGDEEISRRDIAAFITNLMDEETLYLLGAGSTTGAIADRLKISSTLLGIDAVCNGRLVAADLNEQGILELAGRYPKVKIILSPIGAQGFVLGRGNQQISSRVLEKTGLDSLIVIATPGKLQNTPELFMDTGDPVMNGKFGESILVICGYAMAQRIRLNR